MKLDKDFRDLLSAFNDHRVKYLVVGGYAVGFHDEPRATKDIDLWIESSQRNGRALYRALAEYGAPIRDVNVLDFQDGRTFFQLGVAPNRVDVLQHLPGVNFAEAWERRSEGLSDEAIPFYVISRDDLIRNKTAVGRRQDLLDVRRLQGSKPGRRRSDKQV